MASAMSKLSKIGAGALVAGGLFAGATSASAEAGALYRWESQDGTVSFTDDAKRIPERYRGSAHTIDRTVLTDYGRYTPTDRAATDEYSKRLAERLEALRAVNEEAAAPDPEIERTAPATTPRLARRVRDQRTFRRDDGTSFTRYYWDGEGSGHASLPVDPDGPPVVTEHKRVKVPGQPVTQTLVVTRQGDRVLSIVQERRSQYSTLDFGDPQELERETR